MAITKISPSVVDFDAGITISTTDNSTNLTLSSTDADANGGPILDFYRNSSSPADNDVLFQSNIYAENDADEKVAYGYINTFATDVSNGSESMKLNLNMYSAGTALNRFELSSSETVFNQDSGDIDFRVESNANANAFFVDAGGGMVGFNTNTPTSDSGWTGFIHLAHATNNAIVLDGTDSQQAGIGAVDGLYIDCMGHTTATNNNIIFRTTGTDNHHSGTERMRIRSDGNVGIGAAGMACYSAYRQLSVGAMGHIMATTAEGTTGSLNISQNAHFETDGTWETMVTDKASNYYQYGGGHHFRVAGSTNAGTDISFLTAMTMHETSLISAGTTGQHGGGWAEVLHLQGNSTRGNPLFLTGYSGSACSGYQSGSTTSAVNFLYFINSAGTNVGSIQISNSNTATTVSYNTSSDHRLKENVTYDWDGLTKLKQLKPAQFNFKADPDTTIDGFLAHEAQTVVPEAVTGTHNETENVSNAVLNAIGNVIDEGVTEDDWKAGKEAEEGEEPKYAADTTWKAEHTKDVYQGIDQSKLVPLLVKAVQELEAKVKALEEA